MKHYKFIGIQLFINILSIWIWESFLRRTISEMKICGSQLMEYAHISNPWFIIFFLSVNILFASIVIRRKKPEAKPSPLNARALNAWIDDKPIKCSHCGYSFSIMPKLEDGMSHLVKNPKCPKCANIEEILKFYQG